MVWSIKEIEFYTCANRDEFNPHPLTPFSLDPLNARVLTRGRFLKGVSLISLT